jgi:hypothetical protein
VAKLQAAVASSSSSSAAVRTVAAASKKYLIFIIYYSVILFTSYPYNKISFHAFLIKYILKKDMAFFLMGFFFGL